MPIQPEPQLKAEPIDEVTRAALDKARAQIERGEGVPLDEVRKNVKNWYKNSSLLTPSPN